MAVQLLRGTHAQRAHAVYNLSQILNVFPEKITFYFALTASGATEEMRRTTHARPK